MTPRPAVVNSKTHNQSTQELSYFVLNGTQPRKLLDKRQGKMKLRTLLVYVAYNSMGTRRVTLAGNEEPGTLRTMTDGCNVVSYVKLRNTHIVKCALKWRNTHKHREL